MKNLFFIIMIILMLITQAHVVSAKGMDMDALPEVQNGTVAIER